jgi:hypothetical protein
LFPFECGWSFIDICHVCREVILNLIRIELNISTIWLFAVKNFPNDCLGIFDPGTRDPGLGPYDTIAFDPDTHDPGIGPYDNDAGVTWSYLTSGGHESYNVNIHV